METPIGEVLPVEDNSRRPWYGYLFRIKATDPNHPLMKGIPWGEIWFGAHNRPEAKPGSTVLAITCDERGDSPRGSPFICYWDFGKGRSMALVFDWGANEGWGAFGPFNFYVWTYWKDAMARWAYFPAGVEIPDIVVAHSVRKMISDFTVMRGVVISMLEFMDKLGANTRSLEAKLSTIVKERQEIDSLWVEGDFAESESLLSDILNELDQTLVLAVKAKNRALAWVYLVEWAVVTGTSCVAATVLWSLMVKRKMYAEVGTTMLSAESIVF